MYDEADNLYLACFHEEDNAFFKGILLRINKGETEFDTSYNGYPNADGKLLTVQYLEGNKALVYARNDNADRPAADKQTRHRRLLLTTTPSSILPPEPRHA